MLKRISSLLLLVSVAVGGTAVPAQEERGEAVTLEALAAQADYIGLVQVDDREYEEIRDIPTKGVAFLKSLVTYRHPGDPRHPPEEIQMHEEGVGDDKCYYPERRNEGHRFLAFLQKRPGKDGFTGERPGCMLPVYVTKDNRYALRYPIQGLRIEDPSLIRELQFSDPDAFVDSGEELSYGRTRELREQGLIRQTESGEYVYTHGVYLSDLRPRLLASNDG